MDNVRKIPKHSLEPGDLSSDFRPPTSWPCDLGLCVYYSLCLTFVPSLQNKNDACLMFVTQMK